MLKERFDFTDDDGNVRTITVDEILKSYEIKGLNLEELQEKYVNTVDEYEEKINEYEDLLNNAEDNYEEINNKFSTLTETVEDLREELQIKDSNENNSYFFLSILLIAVVISFFIGKSFTKK